MLIEEGEKLEKTKNQGLLFLPTRKAVSKFILEIPNEISNTELQRSMPADHAEKRWALKKKTYLGIIAGHHVAVWEFIARTVTLLVRIVIEFVGAFIWTRFKIRISG